MTTRETALATPVILATGFGYRPFGPADALDHGNGVVMSRLFDLDGRITENDAFAGTAPILDRDYAYDLSGDITGITDYEGQGLSTWEYDYDPLHRLTLGRRQLTDGVPDEESYAYDAVGNRTTRVWVQAIRTTTETYAYDSLSNRLASVTADSPRAGPLPALHSIRTLGYNDSGNTETDDTDTGALLIRGYDATDRMVSIDDGAGTAFTYLHNAAVSARPSGRTVDTG